MTTYSITKTYHGWELMTHEPYGSTSPSYYKTKKLAEEAVKKLKTKRRLSYG